MRPRGHHPVGGAGQEGAAGRASSSARPQGGGRVRRQPPGRPGQGGERRRQRGGERKDADLHREGQLRRAAGRVARPPSRQPRQPRAQPRGGLSHLLPAGRVKRGIGRGLMLRVGLRFQRSSAVGYTVLGAFLALLQVAGFDCVAGTTAAERSAFAAQMEVFGRQVSYLLPLPVRVDTLGGFLQWRLYGIFPVVFAFWAVLAATGMARGEEERGLTDCWLSAGVSRVRLVVAGTAAFLGAAAAVLAVVGV